MFACRVTLRIKVDSAAEFARIITAKRRGRGASQSRARIDHETKGGGDA